MRSTKHRRVDYSSASRRLPPSVQTGTSGLSHLATVAYDLAAVANLKANLPFLAACERKRLANRNGKTLQLFGYDLLSGNTTPGSEGTVGAGIAPSTSTRSVTVNQYFDYMSFSDMIVDTAIDPIVENSAAELGYRAALTVNSLVSTEFDVVGAATAVNSIDLSDNEFMSAAIARQAVMSLRGKDVRPKGDGYFYGVIHPFAAFDLINDNTAGGTIDVLKYTQSGQDTLQRGIQGYRVIEIAGVRWIETTTVPTTANFPSARKTGYHSYVVGMNAVFAINLGATDVPGEQNFRLITKNYGDGTVADPANVIGASVAYNFRFGVIRRPGNTAALRRIRKEVAIT
jgi:N4-gp56 family major capsid protein